MAETISIFKGSIGINNITIPERQKYNRDMQSVPSLKEAIDVYIDETGAVRSRGGQQLIVEGSFHSLLEVAGGFLVAKDRADDSALMFALIEDNGITLTGIRSGLTKGRKISYIKSDEKILYANGFENGQITQRI